MEYKLFDLSEVNGWVDGLEENGLKLVAKTNAVVEICDNYKIGNRYYHVCYINPAKGEVGVEEIKFKDVIENIEYEEEFICPYCGEVYEDAWELDSKGVIKCPSCSSDLEYQKDCIVTYSVYPKNKAEIKVLQEREV